eukprot:TRINITY_DN9509_c0_g1_i1.p1 TRINITY_DN9509_c0_g1~~TRINITY_DN9509_c0_g1_i1.p1  ORF type:complete len:996 (+),score=291.75 TRINITY_DN9509_c0_g1_i1:115-3102(+)
MSTPPGSLRFSGEFQSLANTSKSEDLTQAVDLEKFNKLLQEYARIKKNNAVLKKAILQEQDKVASMEKNMKGSEEKIRHYMQDNDSLNFNNDRLTKRLEGLQEQIHEIQQKGNGGGWFGGKKVLAKKDEEIKVLQDELASKIQENENLHSRVTEIRKEHQTATDLLNVKLSSLKNNLQQQQEELDSERNKHQQETKKLEAEVQQCTLKVASLKQTLDSCITEKEEKELEMKTVNAKLNVELAKRQELIQQKILFDDTKYSHLNSLNIPAVPKIVNLEVYNVANRGIDAFQLMVKLLDEHHAAWVDKLNFISKNSPINENLRTINKKIILLLPQYAKLVATIGETFQWVFMKSKAKEPVPSDIYKTIAQKFQQFSEFSKNMLSCNLLRLDEESKQNNVPTSIQANNSLLSDTRFQLQANLEQMVASICQFLVPLNESKSNVVLLKDFLSNFKLFISTFKTHLTQLAYKISQEHQDPFILPALRDCNERILSTQSAASTAMDNVADSVSEYVQILSKPNDFPIRGVVNVHLDQSKIGVLQARAQKFASALCAQVAVDLISYDDAIKYRDTIPQLQSQIQQLTEDLGESRKQANTLTGEKRSLQIEVMAAKDRLAEKQSQVTSLLEELATARNQISVLNTAYERVAAAHNHLQEQHKTKVHQLQQQIQQVQSQLQQAQLQQTSQVQLQVDENSPAAELSVAGSPPTTSPLLSESGDISEEIAVPVSPISDASNLISFDDGAESLTASVPELSPQLSTADLAVEVPSTPEENMTKSESPKSPVDLLMEENMLPLLSPPLTLARGDSSMTSQRLTYALPTEENQDGKWRMTVMDENGKQFQSLNSSASVTEDLERETAMKMFYDQKLKTLSSQLQSADDKAVKCYHAYRYSKKQLELMQQDRDQAHSSLQDVQRRLDSSLEDMNTTRKNYDEQMNVLTEHMTIQNERIAQQDNETGSIMNSKVLCTKCKKWNTVRWLMNEGKNGQRCSSGNHGTNFNFAS